ncbi:MAG: DUF1223 domain-containing protein [Beijerinckiaceae bacterium]|jgi:hypothetical protein
MRHILLAMLAALLAGPAAAGAPERLVTVELFTSEGCSSCPPADTYLSELAQNRRDILPLAFHVTYWNQLGWRDPFSLEAATERQYVYSRHFGKNSVFTPQMVVDGAKSLVGSDRDEAEKAIRAAKTSGLAVVPLSLARDGGTVTIKLGAGAGSGRVLLIGFDHLHRTPVGRGENGGHTLTESNIVRSIRDAGAWTGVETTLSAPVPEGEDAAVLLQAADGTITGAARL